MPFPSPEEYVSMRSRALAMWPVLHTIVSAAYHKQKGESVITELQPNEIFVFGSNLNGHHLGGAAAQAHKQFGAIWGVWEGRTGQSYAFPTLDRDFKQLPMSRLRASRDMLYKVCMANPDKRFLLTKVGTGIAGYPDVEMKALFTDAPINLIKPDDWN